MFESALWICAGMVEKIGFEPFVPSPYIARTFFLKDVPAKAKLNICGYGEAAYYLNGRELPDGIRPTLPSTTPKTVVYNVFDLTFLLRAGKNRLGILLSHHRLRPRSAHPLMKSGMVPEVILQLDIVYPDGTEEHVCSDTGFRYHLSPVIFTNNVCGEIHDARYRVDGWCDPAFDDSTWTPVSEAPAPGGEYREMTCPPIRRIRETEPVSITDGLYDFGTVTSGQVRAMICGKSGTRIRIRYAERLTEDGRHVDMSAFQKENRPYPEMYNTAEFILAGTGDEVFEELFSIHGFRYVEVSGEYDSIRLTAVTVHTDMRQDSFFRCGDETLNRLHEASVHSILTCCQGYFVDNPKRDAAWIGDQMLSAEAIAMNFDSCAVLLENMRMCRDAMTDEGELPHIVPAVGDWNYHDFLGPDWSDGVVFHVPYYTYLYTGNRQIVDEMWETMERVFRAFSRFAGRENPWLLDHGGTGDWSAVRPGCRLEVAMTVYYRIAARMMAELAAATGRDAAPYTATAEHIRTAYRDKYVADGNVQAAHISELILPAASGMLEACEMPGTVDRICAMIRDDGDTFTFGVHGMRMVYELLSEYGQAELLLKVLRNKDGYGFARFFEQGYDTLPERFDADKNGIYSFNHHFMSGADAWLYRWIAGIRVSGFGGTNVTIAPLFLPGIGFVTASLHGIRISYDEKTLTVDSPYPFRLLAGRNIGCFDAGRYEFLR